MITPEELKEEYLKIYHESENPILIVSAPARINIIGEHIDYNGGFVFPTAIDRYLYVAIRKRNDNKVFYKDLFYHDAYEFDINDNFEYKEEYHYGNYLNGILAIMKRRGYKFSCGFEMMIASNVPSAGGISSSSALECGFAWAVSELYKLKISRKDIALIGQQSEHEFMNVKCGIMDQYVIATAKSNTAELLDCEKVESEYVPLNLGDYKLVVMNTKKKRSLAESKYNERREECEKGLEMLKNAALPLSKNNGEKYSNTKDLPNLCSLSPSQLEECKSAITDEVILKRVRHAVSENQRVLDAVQALKKDDLESLGKLLYASHASLKDDYEVSCEELDVLVELASQMDGCIGARMTGAGFGGCAIALVNSRRADAFMGKMNIAYTKAVGHDGSFFACSSGDGVKIVQ
ncbi:MAG: galactokinase [Treponema sp.]|nr:galactokinase [Treponema sp.]